MYIFVPVSMVLTLYVLATILYEFKLMKYVLIFEDHYRACYNRKLLKYII